MSANLVEARGGGVVDRRLWKELKLVRVPFVAALVAGVLSASLTAFDATPDRMFPVVPMAPLLFVFFGCVLFIGTAPFGREYQHRTWPLLFSQPCERSRLWADKLKVSAAGVFGAALIVFLARLAVGQLSSAAESERAFNQTFYAGLVFLVGTVCTAPLWTLVARSTVGGMALTVACLFLMLLVADYVGDIIGLPQEVDVGLGAIAYSAVCLWLGWRKFSRLELRETFAGSATVGEEPVSRTETAGTMGWRERLSRVSAVLSNRMARLDRVLRPRPTGVVGNLFRKELRLQRPSCLVAALFTVSWMVVFGLWRLQPDKGYEHLFEILVAFYAPLILFLAATMSNSEENSLGVAGWHLTLPVASWKQWLIRLAASLTVGAGVGWILPLVLVCLTNLVPGKPGPAAWVLGEPGLVLLCISGVMFVLGFWAVALVGNTVRATLLALAALVAFVACFGVGSWAARASGGISGTLLAQLAAANDWTRDSLYPPALWICLWAWRLSDAVVPVLVLIALGQSLRLHRRPSLPVGRLALYPLTLIVASFLAGFLQSDLSLSAARGFLGR